MPIPRPNQHSYVLIADDHESVRNLLTLTLGRAGFVVDSVSDQEEAVAAIKTVKYDVLIADLHLGSANGMALLQFGRRVQPGLATILVTGDPNPQVGPVYPDGFLSKPWPSIRHVTQLIDLVIDQRRRELQRQQSLADSPSPAPTLRHTPDLTR